METFFELITSLLILYSIWNFLKKVRIKNDKTVKWGKSAKNTKTEAAETIFDIPVRKVEENQRDINLETMADIVNSNVQMDVYDNDEYKSDESYYAEMEPYQKKIHFNEVDHTKAYEKNDDSKVLTPMEKGIIFTEVLGKPVSMRK